MQNKNKVLRILIFVNLLALIFILSLSWASFKVNPAEIMKYFGAQVGSSIGVVSVSVSENPFNTLAQQLEEKEAQLQEKEKTLEQRETGLEKKGFSEEGRIILGLTSGLLITLLILILLNFYFDYKRTKYMKAS